ncbi:hypothetical protein [Bifidobacterium sp. SO1]|uniref:hypothetical protein n=1 Tax=Bifidobacterium sp. SO1 TaxID=2809029 RepID=UPI001BDC64D1|nr:hypothetical protein [Bifidobacterium sp. SO1]MBT1160937.1 hypothetical protein [Bifidobacterium sp. SO1]
MSYEYVRFRCGHSRTINADGPYRIVKQRIERAQQEECDQCRAARNRSDGFRELWGSRQDRARAERIRRETLDRAIRLARRAPERESYEWRELIRLILDQNDAAWWSMAGDQALVMLAQEIRL